MTEVRAVIYSYGRSFQRTLVAGGAAAGKRFFETKEGAQAYDEGDIVFLSNVAGTVVECVGAVRKKDGAKIFVQRPLLNSYAEDDLVWQGSSVVVMPYPPDVGNKEHDDGVKRSFTMDGLSYAVRSRSSSDFRTINYPGIDRDALESLLTFLKDSDGVDSGLNDFVVSLRDEQTGIDVVETVRLISPVPGFKPVMFEEGAYSIKVQVVSAAGYPSS